ncbi:MAG: hypothetical protein JWP11_3720 [Frankiales bacterium]|nr:hypothetical protein [Frankiales bacterium]
MGGNTMAGALVRLRVQQFAKIAASKDWNTTTSAAKAIGCEVSTLSRILRGERACGGEFIANLLVAAKPWDFNDLFEVETGDEPVSA